MKPKQEKPVETDAQKQTRIRAEKTNVRAIQRDVQERTSLFRRLKSPRISISNGKMSSGISLMS